MANSLLDFVISLVRDPEAAARYAANPAKSIADARLADVTSADVNNLIPMVSDSLSMSPPPGVTAGAQVAEGGNVWASGAATAALDAFSPHTAAGVGQQNSQAGGVINQPASPAAGGSGGIPADPYPAGTADYEPSVLFTGVEMADPTFGHGGLSAVDPGLWDPSVVDQQAVDPDPRGFGIDI